VRALSGDERSRLLGVAQARARLYGATGAPRSEKDWWRHFESMRPLLEPSTILREFLSIMRTAPVLPPPARPLQRLLIRSAVDLLPSGLRTQLDIEGDGLRPGEAILVRTLCGLADRVVLSESPAVRSCRRLGLPADYLYGA